jgi:ribosomal protein L11 methyltransferase
MNFIEVRIEASAEISEILIAELAEIGFDTFEETETGVNAYIEQGSFDKELLDNTIERYRNNFPIRYQFAEIERKNWNEEWEKNFQPIEIKGICRVIASFHKSDPSYPYEIVINPKMTFGTGHHSTTSSMMEFQLEQDYINKKVADIGCGTGILAILASKLGAREVVGIEIEDWSVENARENVELNGCKGITIYTGTLEENEIGTGYDIVLANINKNVLLDEIRAYAQLLKKGGELLLSGFYEDDIIDLERKAAEYNLKKRQIKVKDNWAAVLFVN